MVGTCVVMGGGGDGVVWGRDVAGGGNDFSMMDGDWVVGTCVVMGWGGMEWCHGTMVEVGDGLVVGGVVGI